MGISIEWDAGHNHTCAEVPGIIFEQGENASRAQDPMNESKSTGTFERVNMMENSIHITQVVTARVVFKVSQRHEPNTRSGVALPRCFHYLSGSIHASDLGWRKHFAKSPGGVAESAPE